MRHLILFRHAKSDWDADYEDDHDRPLAKRGRKAARVMGEFLRDVGMAPDMLLSSSALRARSTAELAMEAGSWRVELEATGALYLVSPLAAIDVVRQIPGDCSTVVLVGHEPTWSECAGALIGSGRVRMPTAAMACIAFDRPWREVVPGVGELQWLVPPKVIQKARS